MRIRRGPVQTKYRRRGRPLAVPFLHAEKVPVVGCNY